MCCATSSDRLSDVTRIARQKEIHQRGIWSPMKVAVFFFLFFSYLTSADANSCLFCKKAIVLDEAVLTTNYYHVIPDREPRVKGHLLVIPKRHIAKAHELTSQEWEELHLVIPKIVGAFAALLNTDQYIILEKNGPNAFQQIQHVHFHLFPVTNQTWSEIFDVVPKRLSKEELKGEIDLYRSYFDTRS